MARAVSASLAELKVEEEEEGPILDDAAVALWLTPDVDSLPTRVFDPPVAGDAAAASPQPVVRFNPEVPEPLRFRYGEILSELSVEALEYVLNQGVRKAALPISGEAQGTLMPRRIQTGEQATVGEIRLVDVPDPIQAQETLNGHLLETAKRAARSTERPDEWAKLHDAALAMGVAFCDGLDPL